MNIIRRTEWVAKYRRTNLSDVLLEHMFDEAYQAGYASGYEFGYNAHQAKDLEPRTKRKWHSISG
jgi:hypothetical protein